MLKIFNRSRMIWIPLFLAFSLIETPLIMAETQVGGSIASDTTWNLAGSPYIVTSEIYVADGVILTVEKGVTVKVNKGFSIYVVGTLNALCDDEWNGILFTSNQVPKAVGDWNGITFFDGSGGTLQHCLIEYADIGIHVFANTSPQFLDCGFYYNNRGIEVMNFSDNLSHPLVKECSFNDNADIGIFIYGNTSPQILNCEIYNNNRGIQVAKSVNYVPQPVVNGCSLTHNNDYNFYVGGGGWNNTVLNVTNNWWGKINPQEIGSSIFDYNESDERAMVDFTSFLDAYDGNPVDTAPGGETYLIGGTTENMTLSGAYIVPIYFKVNPGHEVTISPGTTVKFMAGAKFIVGDGGILTAGDAAGSPVVFTSGLSSQAPGDWNGINFIDGSGGTLQNCVVEYADIGIYIYRNTSPQILNCTIRKNKSGIQVKNYYSAIPNPVVNECSLHDNDDYNFYVASDGNWNTTISDAAGNWWGTQNPNEITETIRDYNDNNSVAQVDFDPWKHEIVDEDGPIISDIRYNTITISSNATIDQPGTFTLQAVDAASGVERVEFYIDTELKHIVSTASGSYSFDWNIVAINDGYYNFTAKAYDTLGNVTEELLENLEVALAAPDSPVITFPESGLLISRSTVTVTGTASKYSEVTLFNNDAQVISGVNVNTDGGFSITIPLVNGANSIQTHAENRGGQSAKSDAVSVTMDPNALATGARLCC
jgi:parallel beta-helix repeat protein